MRGPTTASDPVNVPMIRQWTAAFEDANPAYLDAVAAERSRHGGLVAPPLMLPTWTMPTPAIAGITERGGAPVTDEAMPILRVLDDAGFTGTLASGSEVEIERYLRIGEVVTAQTVLESVSEETQTRVGRGHFVTWVTTYTVDGDEIVGRERFRILKFAPGAAP